MLDSTQQMQCTPVFAMNSDAACASLLTMIKAANLCTTVVANSSGQTGTTVSSGQQSSIGQSSVVQSGTTTTTTTGQQSSVVQSSGTTGESSVVQTSGTMGSGGSSCDPPPKGPFPETTAGVYCPFGTPPAGKTSAYCSAPTPFCCEPGAGTSTCAAASSDCASGDTIWQCGAKIDCPGGVCCANGSVGMQAACGTYPAYAYGSMFKGTVCASSCDSSQFQVCGAASDCSSGQTCVPIKAKGSDFGYCM